MRNLTGKLYVLLSPRERWQVLILLVIMIVRALIETAGIASVAPFLAVVGNPEIIETNRWLFMAYEWSGCEEISEFLVLLGVFSILVLLFSAGLRALAEYAKFRFTDMRGYTIGQRLLKSYLRRPYTFYLQRNSSDMTKNMLSEVDWTVKMVLLSTLILTASVMVSIAIMIMLIMLNPWTAIVTILIFGGMYYGIYRLFKKRLVRIGEIRQHHHSERFKVVSETFGGIKELKVLGREYASVKAFSRPALLFARNNVKHKIMSMMPKFAVEAIAFTTIIIIAMHTAVMSEDSIGVLLPVLGLYTFSAYRLLPSFQSIYFSVTQLRFGLPALNDLLRDLSTEDGDMEIAAPGDEDVPLIHLKKNIEFEDISFTFPGAAAPALKGINLTVPANTSMGLIGTTGAGKTTLVDLLLGLLQPDSGRLLVDGTEITPENLRLWQQNIGYVPQHIFLADDTVTNNIAFGIPEQQVDLNSVKQSAKMAAIAQFIEDLPQGYNTVVGERGVRLSGGERQRIGIARALYHNPDILVLDEATSALDNDTEAEIMKSIYALSGQKTIIMIAHRLSTIEKCDRVVKLERGIIVQE